MQSMPRPRSFAGGNWRGLWTLFWRGALRFLKLSWETIGGPCVSSLLFLAVFVLAAGEGREIAPGLSLPQFIIPGIIILALSQSAFQMAAFPLLYDKMEGMIGDILSAPLSPGEILAGYVAAATASALVIGVAVFLLSLLFVDLPLTSPLLALLFAVATAVLFALAGTLTGIWADKWEHYSVAENFLILPLGFLSGTFFTLAALPPAAQTVVALNPVFYAINGFRAGLAGFSESSLLLGIFVLILLDLCLASLAWRLFAKGYKIKP